MRNVIVGPPPDPVNGVFHGVIHHPPQGSAAVWTTADAASSGEQR
jgi:hypothetical protein